MNEIPEYYSDAIGINLNMPWTVALTFGLRATTPDQKSTDVVRVRMSPEHAKVTAMLLRKNIKKYEEQAKTSINLPAEMYTRLGLDSIDDW